MNLKSLMLTSAIMLNSSNFVSYGCIDEYSYYNFNAFDQTFIDVEMEWLKNWNEVEKLFGLNIYTEGGGEDMTFTSFGFSNLDVYYHFTLDDMVNLYNYSLENDTCIVISYVGFGDYDLSSDSLPTYFNFYIVDSSNTMINIVECDDLLWGTIYDVSELFDPNQIEELEGGEFEAKATNTALLPYCRTNIEFVESPSLTDNLFTTIGDTISAYVGSITTMFNDLMLLFYADNKLTYLSQLLLVGIGIGITKWGMNFVKDRVRL